MKKLLLPASLSGALLGVVLVSPSYADPDAVDRLAAVLEATKTAENPNETLYRGLAALPDLEIGAAGLDEARRRADLPPWSLVTKTVDGITSLEKRGDRVRFGRPERARIDLGQGWLELGREAEFRISVGADEVEVDDSDGIRVGKNAHDFHPLIWMRYLVEDGRQVMKIKAGYFIFNETATIDLESLENPGPTGGLAGGVGQ